MTRVVLKRAGSVNIGRGTTFGNPYKKGEVCCRCGRLHADPQSTLPCFAAYFADRIERDASYRMAIADLRGHDLWCPGLCKRDPTRACHGDIYVDWIRSYGASMGWCERGACRRERAAGSPWCADCERAHGAGATPLAGGS